MPLSSLLRYWVPSPQKSSPAFSSFIILFMHQSSSLLARKQQQLARKQQHEKILNFSAKLTFFPLKLQTGSISWTTTPEWPWRAGMPMDARWRKRREMNAIIIDPRMGWTFRLTSSPTASGITCTRTQHMEDTGRMACLCLLRVMMRGISKRICTWLSLLGATFAIVGALRARLVLPPPPARALFCCC